MNIAKYILVDTGFFFALFNEKDRYHASARRNAQWLDILPVLLPWPILYETINTRFVRRDRGFTQFQAIVESRQTEKLDDSPYRGASYAKVLTSVGANAPLSLVDAVLCSIIEDVNVPVDALLTFNAKDFWEVCLANNVTILDEN